MNSITTPDYITTELKGVELPTFTKPEWKTQIATPEKTTSEFVEREIYALLEREKLYHLLMDFMAEHPGQTPLITRDQNSMTFTFEDK